jgi:hypothetical protein
VDKPTYISVINRRCFALGRRHGCNKKKTKSKAQQGEKSKGKDITSSVT